MWLCLVVLYQRCSTLSPRVKNILRPRGHMFIDPYRKKFLSETRRPKPLIFSTKLHLADPCQTCSNKITGPKNGSAVGHTCFQNLHRVFLCPRWYFGRHIKIAPSVRLSVRPSVRYKSCLSDSSNKANLMKFHRKIKDNKKLCRADDLGSYAQCQGHNQVRGPNPVSAITQKLLKQI